MLKTVHWFIVRLTTKPSLYWWQWRPFCSSSGSGGQTPSGAVTSTQGSAFSGRPQRGQGRAFGSCPAVWPHVPCWDGWNLFGYFSHPFGWVLNSLKKEKEKKKKKPQSWTSPLSASQPRPRRSHRLTFWPLPASRGLTGPGQSLLCPPPGLTSSPVRKVVSTSKKRSVAVMLRDAEDFAIGFGLTGSLLRGEEMALEESLSTSTCQRPVCELPTGWAGWSWHAGSLTSKPGQEREAVTQVILHDLQSQLHISHSAALVPTKASQRL